MWQLIVKTSLKVSSGQKQPFGMFCDELDLFLIDTSTVFCAKFDLNQNNFLQFSHEFNDHVIFYEH